ncbi:MAG: AMP-binding protein [Gammaproteobacteria bacterium]|nr:AMP-binding protein [Gammaproteobacteria bacterium]
MTVMDSCSTNRLWDLLATRDPSSTCCIRSRERISWGAFMARAVYLARRLPAQPCLANLCEDRLDFLLVFCAALLAGKQVLLPQNRQPAALQDLAVRYPDMAWVASEALDDVMIPLQVVRWDELCPGDMSPDFSPVPLAAPAVTVFTSGSTGVPQAHGKHWDLLESTARAALQRFGLEAQPIVATVPPQHMFGLECSILLPLVGGMPVYGGRPFYPEDLRQALLDVEVPAMLVTTPVHLRAVVRAGLSWPGIAGVISATAPLGLELAQEAERVLGVPVDEIYGCTETGAVASRRQTASPYWRVFDGIDLRQDGEAAVVSGLPWPGPMRLPDLVTVHDAGQFELLARPGDMVNVAGKRASLADLNRLLLSIDGVVDGVIFMPEDGDALCRPAALVVADGVGRAGILSQLAGRIDPVFLPRPLRLVDRLPRTEAGKLRREDLLQLLAAS